MLSDPGFLSLILILGFWIALIFIGFLVAFFPGRFRNLSHRRQARSGKEHTL